MTVWLKASWSVHTVFLSIHVRRDEKGFSLRLSLLSFILLTRCQSTAKKNHISFVVSCLVSTVFSSRTVYTERTLHIHKVGCSRLLVSTRSISWFLAQAAGLG